MKILCATDLLPKTESAIERAAMLAEQMGATLSLLHAVPMGESNELLQEDMQRAQRLLGARAMPPRWRFGAPATLLVRPGNVAAALIEATQELKPDLLVLGAHRRRPVADALAGTIAERLLASIACPLLIVRRMPWAPYRNALLALDRSEASATAVHASETLALSPDARLRVVHTYEVPYEQTVRSLGVAIDMKDDYARQWKQQAEATLSEWLATTSADASQYELVLEHAATTDGIRDVIRRLAPDLLVLGNRGHGRFRRALLGSVASRILATARADLLVVPHRWSAASATSSRSDICSASRS
jgi:universal stress protein E